jgi:hypothetical protein
MVPDLLDLLEFRSNNELHQPVIQALCLVKAYARSHRPFYPEEEIIPIKGVVAAKWQEFVVEKGEDGISRVNRLNYEMCVLQALRDKLRTKEIWVVGANRFRNPDDDLPTDGCRRIGRSITKPCISHVKQTSFSRRSKPRCEQGFALSIRPCPT